MKNIQVNRGLLANLPFGPKECCEGSSQPSPVLAPASVRSLRHQEDGQAQHTPGQLHSTAELQLTRDTIKRRIIDASCNRLITVKKRKNTHAFRQIGLFERVCETRRVFMKLLGI